MSTIIALLAWLLLILLAIPSLVFLVEVGLGLLPARARAAGAPARFTILMPAHDEEATLPGTAGPLARSLPPEGRLLVVADNCSDRTAAVAAGLGAQVTVRSDPSRRGKGFALDHGRAALALDPPAVVVILDADCRFRGDGPEAARLAAIAQLLDRPVQAHYILGGGAGVSPMVQISSFAMLVKNVVRQRGLVRLGAPALLGGTGMALPWRLFATAKLATDDLVEDLALGLELAEAGEGARYCDDVLVTSAPSSEAGTLVQRTRWEHGFLQTARRHGLRLVSRGLRGRPDLLWFGLHLLTPPLALLVALLCGGVVLELLFALLGAGPAPVLLTLLLLILIGAAVMAAWSSFGRDVLEGRTLARLPLYVLWKVPVYLGFARRRETAWVRSDRGGTPLH